jgi:Conjugal transfer protein TraD
MSEKAALIHHEKRNLHAKRKARTRTLIQMGGLLKLAGLFDIFGIQEGEDLQLNPEAQEKANALLGWLWSVLQDNQIDAEQLQSFAARGRTALRMHQAKHYH